MIVRLIAPEMRSTPLRLTGMLILIFTFSSLVTFGIAYLFLRNTIDTVLEEQLNQSVVSYTSIKDANDLEERLIADAKSVDPSVMIFTFEPTAGPTISNVTSFPLIAGLTIVRDADIVPAHRELSDSYLAIPAQVAGGRLIVAQTRGQIIEMGEVFAAVFLIGLLPTLLIASTVGLLAARRARDRVEAIRTTLLDLTHGTLTSRVPNVADVPDDLEQIGLAVNRMATAQAKTVASLKQVSDDIAHDLKTPIQRVAIQLGRLQNRKNLDAEQAEIVENAVIETEGIVRTFQSLLQIAQIESGRVKERFVPVDVRQLSENLVEAFTPIAEESDHVITFASDQNDAMFVQGDRQLLSQVLVNLLENGLRHVPSGGAIIVQLSQSNDHIELAVSDDGPGVPTAEREKVLRRLYRLERSRTSEGNGLGLSLVAAICELHDAKLTLADAMPGLIVRIVFPIKS